MMVTCKMRTRGKWTFGWKKHRGGLTRGPGETERTCSSQGCVFLTAFISPWNDDGVCYNNGGGETGCRPSRRHAEGGEGTTGAATCFLPPVAQGDAFLGLRAAKVDRLIRRVVLQPGRG